MGYSCACPGFFSTLSYSSVIFQKQLKKQPETTVIIINQRTEMQNKSSSQLIRKSYNLEQTNKKQSNHLYSHSNRLLTLQQSFKQPQKFTNTIKQMQFKIEGVQNLMKKKSTCLGNSMRVEKKDGKYGGDPIEPHIEISNMRKTQTYREAKNKQIKNSQQAKNKTTEALGIRKSYRLPEPNKYNHNQQSPVKGHQSSILHTHQHPHSAYASTIVPSTTSTDTSPSPIKNFAKQNTSKSFIETHHHWNNDDSFSYKMNSSYLKNSHDVTREQYNQVSFNYSPVKQESESSTMKKTNTLFSLKSIIEEQTKILSDVLPAVKSDVVQGFELGQLLGKGKFGQVYLARHVQTGFVVAIKKVDKNVIKGHNMINQFVKEIRLHNSLDHPKIVKFYGFFQQKNDIYLVLQYMNGGTLFDYLYTAGGTLPADEAVSFLRDIVQALIYLHDKSIAHRDIKPQNIVISAGLAKLCDFGWSAVVESARSTFCGTLDYAPPQIIQRKQYDWSVDVWCIGILTYELFIGQAPFQSTDRNQVMQKIVNVDKNNIPKLDQIPLEAKQFIQALLQKDPLQRPKINELLDFALFKNYPTKRKRERINTK